MESATLIQALNFLGTLVFALSGAAAGVRQRMDIFGILVLAFVTAVAGGVIRDLLIGATPPASITNWHALAVSCAAGLFAFWFSAVIDRLRFPVELFDAAGLGIFATTGTQKALEYGIPPVMATILGMVTGIGGGMARDVLSVRMPVVLYSEFYAMAALAGSAVVTVGHALGMPVAATVLPGTALCVLLRVLALYHGFSLPQPRRRDDDHSDR
jgi:uncharacterized membrane protein YeiH